MKFLIFRRADSALLVVPQHFLAASGRGDGEPNASIDACEIDPDQLGDVIASQIRLHGFACVTHESWAALEVALQLVATSRSAQAHPDPSPQQAFDLNLEEPCHGPAATRLEAKIYESLGRDGRLWIVADDSRSAWPPPRHPICYFVGDARFDVACLSDDSLFAIARDGYVAVPEHDRIAVLERVTCWAEPHSSMLNHELHFRPQPAEPQPALKAPGERHRDDQDVSATGGAAPGAPALEHASGNLSMTGLMDLLRLRTERRSLFRPARNADIFLTDQQALQSRTAPDAANDCDPAPAERIREADACMSRAPDFAALFRASPYPYLLMATDYTILHANPAYLAATGRAAQDIVGQHLFTAFPANPDDPASTNTREVARSIDIAVSSRKAHTSPLLRYAVPRDTADGEVFDERYWSAVHTPVLDDGGNVLFVAQNAIDVTDLYRFDPASRLYFLRQQIDAVPDPTELSQPQLHEAMTRILSVERNQLQTLFNQAPGFIAVLMGNECVFDTVNEAYYQLVGHRDILGQPVMQALPELEGQGFEELFAEVLETGRPIVLSERRVAIQRDRTGPLEERFVDLLYQPIFGPDGCVIGIFCQGHDVTAGLLARRALAEKLDELAQARRWSALQLQLADRLRPLHDAAEIFLRSAALIGEHFQARRVAYGEYHRHQKKFSFHSDYVDGVAVDLSADPVAVGFHAGDVEVIEQGGIWVSDDLSCDPRTGGPETWSSFEALKVHAAVVVPLTRQGPSVACMFVGTSTPKTWSPAEIDLLKEAADRVWTAVERVRAEAALRAADERKDQFLAMLAHELRNPLAPIRAAADIQSMAPSDVTRVITTNAIISRQVNHLTSLVNDLLDVSRVTQGLVSLDMQEVDIRDVLADAIEQARPMVEARAHELSLQLRTEGLHVSGDEKRLVQVFANVLNNAAKYTPDGGRISVTAEVSGTQVLVSVADNGIGMLPDVADRAFDLFAQAERTPDRAQGGLGIGLALVKRLVELHGGSVSVRSGGVGAGSEFTVRLPYIDIAKPAPALTGSGSITVGQPLHVLIVDDNRDAAMMMAVLVEASGHTAVVAHDAVEGLKRAIDEPPDACLLDIGLPGMDGHDMARELRCNPATGDAILIAVTGYGHEDDRRRTASAGFDHHLVKPVDASTLVGLLAALPARSARVPPAIDNEGVALPS
ncbi:ATP-binding protein [Lysobacter korlensis]|uniref:histidine kinase n=1 Tax=Lysobacter korlensis TaxID=553636 RepID=A0ABV6RS23_9GAMM